MLITSLYQLIEHFCMLYRRKQTSWMVDSRCVDSDVLRDAINAGYVTVVDIGPPEGEQVFLTDYMYGKIESVAKRSEKLKDKCDSSNREVRAMRRP